MQMTNDDLRLLVSTTERGEVIKYVAPELVLSLASELLQRREMDDKLPGLLRRLAMATSTQRAMIIEEYITNRYAVPEQNDQV